ncbi:calcium-dependent lipid-binding protein-like [Cicer arietinum]|uniref:Synaptotagmin-4-like n=1 Tax=Cicer arietinum TaxID=3827 RepID=A0A1S2XPW5_CICAR|nr:synaptotagmin-4-like [Cicer arietinum]
MGLFFGIFIGIVFGIALMAGWEKMMAYRSARRIAKAIDIKLLGSLNREDLKKICGENLPEWISFPVYEQVKWLNKQLSKLWPFVADAATMVIRESVEPLLEEYRPPGITSLKFSKLSLGNVAPKIEGIRVQSLNKGQIIMDIDFRWGGDPNIVLAVEAALVASIPIQLKDLQVFTIIRVIFQLTDEIPCISAVVVALLAEPKPRIDYTLKAVGGSLTALPGISDMIDDTVNSIVTDMLQWPHRIVVPLGGIPVDTSELELKPQGKLKVVVIKANDLKNMEMIGKSDPYVVIHIRPLFKVKTKVIDNNLNPIWNEEFELIAEDKETQSLILEVFDKDIGQDKRLGIAKLPLIDMEAETEKDMEVRLLSSLDTLKVKDKKDRGTLTIKIFYHQFNKEEQLAALEAEKTILEQRKKLKEEGVIGSTMDALDGAASVVGSGVGMVGSGVAAGAGLVGSGIGAGAGLVGSGIGAGASVVGSGIGAGAGIVGSGFGAVGSGLGAVGSGLSRAGKFMGRTITGQTVTRRSGSTTPVANFEESGGGAKPR